MGSDKPRPGRQPAFRAAGQRGDDPPWMDKHAPESALKDIFDRGHVVVVTDNDRFIGLITRSDVLTTGVTDWNNKERT